MKELFLIRDSLANKISYYHLMLLMASLPFDRFYSHIILISFTIHTLIHITNTAIVKSIFTKRIFILQSVFFVTLASTIYTINRPEAFNEWVKHLVILLIPIVFCLTQLNIKKYRAHLLLAFSLVCTLTVVYLYSDALITIRHYKLPYSTIFASAFINHNFSEPIGMHATFFSMQLAIAFIYILSVLIKERANQYRVFYIICACILFAGLIQLGSKSVFIALLLIINLGVPFLLLQGLQRRAFIWVAAGVSVLLIVGVFTIGTFKARYINTLKSDLSLTPTATRSVDSRLDRWNAASELIAKSPIVGHGAGSEIGLLHEVFFAKKYYSSYLKMLNTHSEYLSFLIKSGVIGLIIYISTLVFGFNISIKKRDMLFFCFITLIAIISFSENLLDVDKGIIFYAFFFSFFMFSANDKEPAKSTV
jgi:O-antigen ligase